MTRSIPPSDKGQNEPAARKPRRNVGRGDAARKKKAQKQDWVINYLLVVSSIVWVANFVIGVFVQSYQGSETVNAVFLAVIGGIFTLKTRQKVQEEEDDE